MNEVSSTLEPLSTTSSSDVPSVWQQVEMELLPAQLGVPGLGVVMLATQPVMGMVISVSAFFVML